MATARSGRGRWLIAMLAVGALAVVSLTACGEGDDPARAEGSGSTFARQGIDAWCAASDLCTYRAVGSGKGVEDVVDQTTEFGASDVPLTPEERQAFAQQDGDVAPEGTSPIQVPVLIGAITVATSVPGASDGPERLRFSGRTLAGVFSGAITRWTDPAIAAENPGVRFPDAPITRCVREDSSGTSAVFTAFLSEVAPAFREAVGASRLPDWPGAGVERSPGNEGVGACLQDRDDAIGYIDLADGVSIFGEGAPPERVTRLAEIGVERAGRLEWVAPTTASTALAGTVELPAGAPLTSYGARLLSAPVSGAYPITATTYLIVHSRYADADTCNQVVQTGQWALGSRGQQALVDAYYAPVSASVRSRGLTELAHLSAKDAACASR